MIARCLVALCVVLAGLSAEDEWKSPSRAAKKKNPIPLDDKSADLGRKVYVKECLSCHGDKGKGDGPSAKDLETKPGDLSDAKLWDQSDGALFWKVTEGRKPMPGFEKTLKEEERWHVVNYMRTLAPRPATVTPPEVSASDTYRSGLSGVLAPYFRMHAALAKDDAGKASAEIAALESAAAKLAEIQCQDPDEKVRKACDEALKQIRSAAATLKDAKDLEALRSIFKNLSDALAAAVAKCGHAEEKPLSLFSCSMAFDGKGAVWLQRGGEPENPYFGAKMPKCGKLEKSLGMKR